MLKHTSQNRKTKDLVDSVEPSGDNWMHSSKGNWLYIAKLVGKSL